MRIFRSKKPAILSRSPVPRSGKPELRSKTFSYHSHRSAREQSASRKEDTRPGSKHRSWHHFPTFLAAIAILFSLGYLLTINPNPRIVILDQTNNRALLRNQLIYQRAAQELLSSSITNLTKITVDSAGFARMMKQQFPELETVSITLPLMGRRPIVEIVPARPAIVLVNQKGSYVVDEQGRALMPVSEAAGLDGLQLSKVGDESNLEIRPGSPILTTSEVSFITEIVAQLGAKNLKVESLTLPTSANELHVRLKSTPYFIKFNTASSARQSAGSFLVLKQKLDTTNVTPKEYIDVRLEERAYYR